PGRDARVWRSTQKAVDTILVICPSGYFVAPVAVYFCSKSPAQCAHPVPPEGRSRTSRTWGQAAVGAGPVFVRESVRRAAGAAPAKPCGPDAPRAGVKFPG